MNRKKFIKYMMAAGYDRNEANDTAELVQLAGYNYAAMWERYLIEYNQREIERIAQAGLTQRFDSVMHPDRRIVLAYLAQGLDSPGGGGDD